MTRTAAIPETVRVGDKTFAPYKSRSDIEKRVGVMAAAFGKDHKGKQVRLVCVDKGARTFCAMFTQALRRIDPSLTRDIDSLRVKSYQGTSGGKLAWIQKLKKPMDSNIHLWVLEDIVDRGHTMAELKRELAPHFASFGSIAMLDKQEARDPKTPFTVDYSGLIIPDLFVVGVGLDYNEKGRELSDLYALYEPGVTQYPFPPAKTGVLRKP